MSQKRSKKTRPPEFFESLRDAVKRNLTAALLVSVTAFAFEKDSQRCLEAGMNGFLTKP